MSNILALLRDLGKIPIARDFFIKLDSIGAKILMLDLRIVVGMLSQPTLLLCLRLVIILVNYRNWWRLKIFCLWNLINKIIFKCQNIIIYAIAQSCRNAIKVRVEWAGNYFGFFNNDAIYFNGGARWLAVFTKNRVDVGIHFLTISKRTLKKIKIILLSGSSGYFSE